MEERQKIIRMLRERLLLEQNYAGNYAIVNRTQPKTFPEVVVAETIQKINPSKNEELCKKSIDQTFLLKETQEQALACTKCKLANTRKQVVFGTGPARADLVIIGEAPGYYEDQSGQPFVGKAGELLTRMLAAIQINRDDIYICNVIKCRPPENRNPTPEEIASCRPWLSKQLEILRPKILCSMGKFAAQFLTNSQQPMWTYREKTFSYEGIPVVCTYHPAYLLRNAEEKKKAWVDLKRLKTMLLEMQ